MKILLTNAFLDLPGGTENWVKTIGLALQKLNHEISIFTLRKGNFSRHLAGLGWEVTDYFDSGKYFDAALVNHNCCLRSILEKRKRFYPLVFTSHSPFEELERPFSGADVYVSVSEETKERSDALGFTSNLIRNPIDTFLFREYEPIQNSIKRILLVSHRQMEVKIFKKLAKALKAKIDFIGHKNKKVSYEVFIDINRADLVLSLGRGCLEAMSCGRNVVVAGRFGLDGFIDNDSILELRKFNCSGRRFNRTKYDLDDLLAEAEKYNAAQGAKNRQYILNNNAADLIAGQYIKLLDDI